jgi:hypothetical protein
MQRRQFISLLGGAVASWPLGGAGTAAGHAGDRVTRPEIADSTPDRMRGFRRGLRDIGFFEGENVAIDLGISRRTAK